MTATATGSSPAVFPYPPAGLSQHPDNRIEQLVVQYVLDGVIESLTDRAGGDHPFPWNPERTVRVGVLSPSVLPQAATGQPSGGAGPNPAAGPGGPSPIPAVMPGIDNRGVLGLDFVVAGDGSPVDLTVEVSYSLYHPLMCDFADFAARAAVRAAAPPKPGKRKTTPNIALNPGWRRDDRHVTVQLSVAVGGDEETVTSATMPGGDPLTADAAAAVAAHYHDGRALRQLKPNQTLPVTAGQGSEADFMAAVAGRLDPNWVPQAPLPALTVSTMPTVTGEVAVSVSLTNALQLLARSRVQDLSLYDAKVTVTVNAPHRLSPKQLGFADDDLRYAQAATVVGRGRGCVARPGDGPETIVAETLPMFFARAATSAVPAGLDISFGNLAGNYTQTLDAIAGAMRAFLRGWTVPGGVGPEEAKQLSDLLNQFQKEVERFELGIDLLRRDAHLDRAFRLANATFAASRRPTSSWRLFQLGFIVSELGGLAARTNLGDPQLQAELDAVDVLWFPTGGGKTEAYLGLIAVALFYDRFRCKERGTTAWLLFPLRMLSVQQLARISEILYHAEQVRQAESIGGDSFALGYLVGSGNTPNRLARPEANGWWPGIEEFAKLSATERDERRLVGACPSCRNKNSVGLDVNIADQRLLHVCRACGFDLPIYASDEEITRYQPAVVVSTVDKITAFARSGQLTAFHHGPLRRCPQHGWYTHEKCVVGSCKVGGVHTAPSGFADPVPALWIQDELHLVREDLGVFAAHYHTLMAELARGAGLRPSKVIAATATIEQFADQLSQVYGRHPRMFPTGGPTLDRSFYTTITDDVRRVYLGVLPSGGGTSKVDLTGAILAGIVRTVHELTDDPAPLIAALAAQGVTLTPADARGHLFDYELALAYVNAKAHGVGVRDDIYRLSEELFGAGSDVVKSEYLSGETSLSALAAVIAAVQENSPATPRADRIRALVATAVVSHGVDLDRLNFEVLAGMPPTYAQYIQVTARAGRSHVGLVVTVFDRLNRREASVYQSFLTTHAALEKMVEPVPVNRFASRAIERTLPGIVCALLWDETRNATYGTTDNIGMTRLFRKWWDANAATIAPIIEDRIRRAYACPVPIPGLAAEDAVLSNAAVARWDQVERLRMTQWGSDWLTDLFTSSAMNSLRDVDLPAEFSAGTKAAQVLDRMFA